MEDLQFFVDVEELWTPSNVTNRYVVLIASRSKQTIVFKLRISYKQYKAMLLIGVTDFAKYVGRK